MLVLSDVESVCVLERSIMGSGQVMGSEISRLGRLARLKFRTSLSSALRLRLYTELGHNVIAGGRLEPRSTVISSVNYVNTGWAKKTGPFLRVYNFATVGARNARDMSKFS